MDGHLDFTVMVVHITWGALESHRKAEVPSPAQQFYRVRLLP